MRLAVLGVSKKISRFRYSSPDAGPDYPQTQCKGGLDLQAKHKDRTQRTQTQDARQPQEPQKQPQTQNSRQTPSSR